MATKGVQLDITLEEREALRSLAKLTRAAGTFSNKASRSFGKLNIAMGAFIGTLASRAVSVGFSRLNQGLASTITLARGFSRGIGEINTLLPQNAKLTEEATNAFIVFSGQFGQAAVNQQKAFYQIVSAGVQTTVLQMEALRVSSISAVGGLSEVGTAADVLTTAFNVFSSTGETFISIADKLFATVRLGKTTFEELAQTIGRALPVAKAAGATFAEFQGTLAFLTKTGIRTDIATVGLRQVFTSLLKPTQEALEAAEDLGIEFSTAGLKAKGFAGFLADLTKKTKGNDLALARLFGNIRALTPILAITRGNFADFERILGEVTNSAGAATNAFKDIQKTFDFQLGRAIIQLKNLGLIIFNTMVPALTEMLKKFNKFLKEFDITKAVNSFVTLASVINAVVVGPLELLFNVGKTIFKVLVLGVQSIVEIILNLGLAITKTLIGSLELFFNVGKTIFKGLILVAQSFFEQIVNIAQKANKVLVFFGADIGLTDALEGLRQSTAENTEQMIKDFVKIKDSITDLKVTAGVIDSFKNLQSSVAETTDQMRQDLIRTAKGILDLSAAAGFQDFIDSAEEMGQKIQASLEKVRKQIGEGLTIDPAVLEGLKQQAAELIALFEATSFAITAAGKRVEDSLNLGFFRIGISFERTADQIKATAKKIAATMDQIVVASISKGVQNITNSLLEGKNAFADFDKFILNILGDMAIQIGGVMIAFGIAFGALFSLSPAVAIGAGIALIAIGTILKSFAGGGGAAAAPAGGGIAAAPAGGGLPAEPELAREPEEAEFRPKTEINLTIQGDVLDSRETGLRIADILEEAFDEGIIVRRGRA